MSEKFSSGTLNPKQTNKQIKIATQHNGPVQYRCYQTRQELTWEIQRLDLANAESAS